MKSWRMKTAHGNYIHVRWLPDGLHVDEGSGMKGREDPIGYSEEFCGTDGRPQKGGDPAPIVGMIRCSCPQARTLKQIPEWWNPRGRQ